MGTGPLKGDVNANLYYEKASKIKYTVVDFVTVVIFKNLFGRILRPLNLFSWKNISSQT